MVMYSTKGLGTVLWLVPLHMKEIYIGYQTTINHTVKVNNIYHTSNQPEFIEYLHNCDEHLRHI